MRHTQPTRRSFIETVFASMTCAFFPFRANAAHSHGKRPNVVVFLVDDMGLMDTSVPMLTDKNGKPQRYPLNDWYRTPNMERLAKKGVRFSNFYAHSVCSPSRVSIMTGKNSARHGATTWINPVK